MTKANHYRETLKSLDDWDSFLLQESGLPGPRGNLELAQVAADEGNLRRFKHFLGFDPQRAPANSPHEFLAFCGVVGLGKLVAQGKTNLWPALRRYAADPRWRICEAVAMALQRVGEVDMDVLLREMETWSSGTWLEKRAAAAALAEPKLLGDEKHVIRALSILDKITSSIEMAEERKSEDFKILRQGLGYCWSVVVAALPSQGKKAMERWLSSTDKDVRWVMQENLKKKRLVKMDRKWVDTWIKKD